MERLKFVVHALFLSAVLTGQVYAASDKNDAGEILTAIDVVELMRNGASDADIAKSLSAQRGIATDSALRTENTDKQVIRYLIINTRNDKDRSDKNKSRQHKLAGDNFFKNAEYDKAAREYSSAIRYSDDDYRLHQLRGNAYKMYLSATVLPSFESYSTRGNKSWYQESKMFLCAAAYGDFRKAMTINNAILADGAVGKTPAARSMRSTYQAQRAVRQADVGIKKDISSYLSVCRDEDARRREFLKEEKAKNRENKWVKLGEKGETTVFYDKTGIDKSKDTMELWIRYEDLNDEKSYDAARVRINCKNKSIAELEDRSYNEIGNMVTSYRNDKGVLMSIIPGTVEDSLFNEVCR